MLAWTQGASLPSKEAAAFKNQNNIKRKKVQSTRSKGNLRPGFENRPFSRSCIADLSRSCDLTSMIKTIRNLCEQGKQMSQLDMQGGFWSFFFLRANKHFWMPFEIFQIHDQLLSGDVRSYSRYVKNYPSSHTLSVCIGDAWQILIQKCCTPLQSSIKRNITATVIQCMKILI